MEFSVHRHGTITSTSELAFEALAAGTARHGDVHVARAQTSGRGRLGRTWHSAADAGLYASLVLLPPALLHPAGLTIAAGLAVHDAVEALGVPGARLKWPNDVVATSSGADLKLAGILVETRGLDPARPHYVVGIGVNVKQTSFPEELVAERPVTSLLLCDVQASVDAVLEALLASLPRRLRQIADDPGALARDYLAASGLEWARVRVVAGDRAIVGRIESMDLERGIALASDDGSEQRLPLEIVREIRAWPPASTMPGER